MKDLTLYNETISYLLNDYLFISNMSSYDLYDMFTRFYQVNR